MLCQIYSNVERRTMATIWCGVGPTPVGPDVYWSPAEASAVIAWHREAAALGHRLERQRPKSRASSPPTTTTICKSRRVRDLHDVGPARLRNRSRHFSPNQYGLCIERSPPLVPVTTLGGVGSRCQQAHAIARAATATKHERGLSPLCCVVSYGSAMEVWALLMRSSQYLRGCRFGQPPGSAGFQ